MPKTTPWSRLRSGRSDGQREREGDRDRPAQAGPEEDMRPGQRQPQARPLAERRPAEPAEEAVDDERARDEDGGHGPGDGEGGFDELVGGDGQADEQEDDGRQDEGDVAPDRVDGDARACRHAEPAAVVADDDAGHDGGDDA